jgi:uncharacterized protein YqhQ
MVGGQAVMEGVMMRVPGFYATAVRTPKGLIQTQRTNCIPLAEVYKMHNTPIVRGFLHLVDSMKIGFKTLEWSSSIADPEETPPGKLTNFFTSIVSILFTIMLFMGIPYFLTEYGLKAQSHLSNNQLNFNIFAGFIRILVFLLYLFLLSRLKEIKTLFEYHGAEHKTVYNFESGKKMTVQNAQQFSTKHPRCGTSFIFILMIVTIFTYSIIDSLFVYITLFQLTIPSRIVLHLCCLPIVSGIGYEVLKFLAKRQHITFFHYLSLPGLWLQYITTNEPNNKQLEVAITALRCAFSDDIKEYEGQQFQADAIG